MAVGRPKKYQPDAFSIKIQEYFKHCLETKALATKGGLAIHLDMTRDMLSDYEKNEQYSNALKKAYTLIEENWVQRLAGNNVAGAIFYLKNAFSKNWRDKQEVDVRDLTDELDKED